MEQWNEYLEALASKAPTPGGGSAAAVYGAIGTALGEMVGNLTSGKKKFAIYEEDVQKILARADGRMPEGCGEGPDGSHGAGGQRDGRYRVSGAPRKPACGE